MKEKIYTCKVCGKSFAFKDCFTVCFDYCICNSCNESLSIPEFLDIIKEVYKNEQK